MGIGYLCRFDYLLHCRSFHSESYVVEYGVIEQNGLLIHISDKASQIFDAEVPDVCSVHGDPALTDIIIPWDKVHQCGFSGSGLSDQGYCLALWYSYVDIVEDFLAFFIAE